LNSANLILLIQDNINCRLNMNNSKTNRMIVTDCISSL